MDWILSISLSLNTAASAHYCWGTPSVRPADRQHRHFRRRNSVARPKAQGQHYGLFLLEILKLPTGHKRPHPQMLSIHLLTEHKTVFPQARGQPTELQELPNYSANELVHDLFEHATKYRWSHIKKCTSLFFFLFTFYFRALNVALKSITTYNYFFPVKAIFYTLHHSLRLASKVR